MKNALLWSLLLTSPLIATATPRYPHGSADPALSDVPAERSGGSYFSEAEHRSAGLDEVNTSRGQYDQFAAYFGAEDDGGDPGCGRVLGDDERP